MPALSVIDLAMFLLETPERPFNIGPLIVLDPPARGRETFADRLSKSMLKRPVGTPFNYRLHTPLIGVPSLQVDPNADPAAHLHRLTLPPPGNFEQLFASVCELHETRLDRSRLLWDLWVIDGLDGGKVALYGKAHHGTIDGRTFVQVVSNWLAATPTERTVRALWEGVPRRPRESAERASIAERLRGVLGKATGTATSAVALYRMLAEQGLRALGVGSAEGLSLPFVGIPKALTGMASAKRSFAYSTLSIPQMKAFGKAHATTLNDLLLTTLDIALDRYLAEQGVRLEKALVAAMPVALKGAGGGNQIAVLQFPLGAPGKDAAARLAAIRSQTAKVKDVVQKAASETVMLYTTLVHGLPALLEKAGSKRGLAVSNMIVSNPFGLPEKRYLMGAAVEMVLPVSVVAAGQMLNVTAVTLDDRLQIGFLAIPEAAPEIGKLARYTVEAFEALQTAMAPPEPGAKAATKPARRTAQRSGAATPRGKPVAAKKRKTPIPRAASARP
jgi:diacylglycerol O-acyltransferase